MRKGGRENLAKLYIVLCHIYELEFAGIFFVRKTRRSIVRILIQHEELNLHILYNYHSLRSLQINISPIMTHYIL